MRGSAFFFLIASLMLSSACSKINDTTVMNITVNQGPAAYNIPIISSLDTGTTIATIPVPFDLDALIKLQNTRLSSKNVKKLRINSINLTITDTVKDVTFANFETLSIRLQGGSLSSNVLATLNVSDSQVKTLNIPVNATAEDLKDIIATGDLKYVIRGTLRKATTKVYATTTSSTFRVELEL
ncbi:MAG: hypothetical protein WKF66_05645 [Pedobacter sp.]